MKKKIIKWGIGLVLVGSVVGASVALYLFNMPHRDVQAAAVDYKIESKFLVQEYLQDVKAANNKYLQEEGDSKILVVSGTIHSTSMDMNNQKVILLKEKGEMAGVSCTFMHSTNANALKLKIGERVTIKGVIRSGAGYDEDLELYEDVILEKCDVFHESKI